MDEYGAKANDTDRGNLKYWDKKLYSMGGGWMDEYWSNGGVILTGSN
jgi:hypothetical protein